MPPGYMHNPSYRTPVQVIRDCWILRPYGLEGNLPNMEGTVKTLMLFSYAGNVVGERFSRMLSIFNLSKLLVDRELDGPSSTQ
jgi:hypothetical protein